MTDLSQPLIGHIDAPNGQSPITRGPLVVRGWALGTSSPVSRIDVALGGRPQGLAGLYRWRPDVAEAFANESAELSGFELRTDLRRFDSREDRVLLTVSATLLDGTCADLAPVEITISPACAAAPSSTDPISHTGCRGPTHHPPAEQPIRLLCFARSLDRGGSQLRMKELVQHLQASGQFETVVIAPTDGPLRPELETLGASVLTAKMPTDDISAYEAELSRMAVWAAGRFDIVLAFTLTSFFGIDLAARLELPSVWRIGENEPVATVFEWLGAGLDPAVEIRAQRAFASASVAVFVSDSTRRSHRQIHSNGHFAVLRNGIDVAGALAYVRATDREACRERLGIAPDRRVLICAATLWPIKGQALLISALKHVCADHPELECVIIGQQVEPYAAALPRLIDREQLAACVRLVPFSNDLRPWWRAADIAACPSESEALSTSALEAMAFGLPVLSSRVGGMPEVVEDGVTGWLFKPNDLGSLIAALKQAAAADPAQLRKLGDAAMSRVARDHCRRELLPRMADLLANVARGSRPFWLQEPMPQDRSVS